MKSPNSPKDEPVSTVTKPLKPRKTIEKAAKEIEAAKKSALKNKLKVSSLGGSRDLWRFAFVWGMMVAGFSVLVARAYFVQVVDSDFYAKKSDEFTTGVRTIAVSRGMITDTNGTPLAANAPLVTVIFNPYNYALSYYDKKRKLLETTDKEEQKALAAELDEMSLVKLASAAGIDVARLQDLVKLNDNIDVSDKAQRESALPKGANSKRFVLLNRVTPEIAEKVTALDIDGVSTEVFSQRFYLQAEPNAQIIGFMARSDKDGEYKGRAGIESQYESTLAGKAGKVLVVKTGGRMTALEEIKEIDPVIAGKDVQLTIDSRLQYVLYKELEQAGRLQSARWASGMVVDVATGDVLAMGSWPSFNSNKLADRSGANERNRSVLDTFEPGSVMKPFTVAAALESGKYTTNTLINTSPGSMRLPGYTIKDGGNYGAITLAKLIQKSSNVASAKIALSLPTDGIVNMQRKFGFGKKTNLNFPAESAGILKTPTEKETSRRATLAYGYGQSVTLAQLAQAYAVLANGGKMQPIRLVKTNAMPVPTEVITEQHAKDIVSMLELVTQPGGTAKQAAIDGYRVAGKTGTTRRANPKGGYFNDQYRTVFAGIVPASNPRFVIVVQLEDPRVQTYAGPAAAPVFAKIAQETLRLYNVPFDKPLQKNVAAVN